MLNQKTSLSNNTLPKEQPKIGQGVKLDPEFARGIGIAPKQDIWTNNEKFLSFILERMKTGNNLHGKVGIRTDITVEELKNLIDQWNRNNPNSQVALPKLNGDLKINLQKTVLDPCAVSNNRSLRQFGARYYVDGIGDNVSSSVHIAKDPLGDQKLQSWIAKEVSNPSSKIGEEIRNRIGADGKLSNSDVNWIVRKYHSQTGTSNLSLSFYKESTKQTHNVVEAFPSLDPLKHKGFTDWVSKKIKANNPEFLKRLIDEQCTQGDITWMVEQYKIETADKTLLAKTAPSSYNQNGKGYFPITKVFAEAFVEKKRALEDSKFISWVTEKANGGDAQILESLRNGKLTVAELEKMVVRYRIESGNTSLVTGYASHTTGHPGKTNQIPVDKTFKNIKSSVYEATVKPEFINLTLYFRGELGFAKLSSKDQNLATLITNETFGFSSPEADVIKVRNAVKQITPALKADSPLVELRIKHHNLEIQEVTKTLNSLDQKLNPKEWNETKAKLDDLTKNPPKLPSGSVQRRNEKSRMISGEEYVGFDKASEEIHKLAQKYEHQFLTKEDKALFNEYVKLVDKYLLDSSKAQYGLVSPEQIQIARKIITTQINENTKHTSRGYYAKGAPYADPMSHYEEIIHKAVNDIKFDNQMNSNLNQGIVIGSQAIGIVAAAKSGQWWAIPAIIELPHLMSSASRAYIYDKPFDQAMKEEWDKNQFFGSPGQVVSEALGADASKYWAQILLMDLFAGAATERAVVGVQQAWTKQGFTVFNAAEKEKLRTLGKKIFNKDLSDAEIQFLEVTVQKNHGVMVKSLDTEVQKISSQFKSFKEKLVGNSSQTTVQISTRPPKDAVFLSTDEIRQRYIAARQNEGASFLAANQESKKVLAFTDLTDPKNPIVYLPNDKPQLLEALIMHENTHVKLAQRGIVGTNAEEAAQLAEFAKKNGIRRTTPNDGEIIELHVKENYSGRTESKVAAGGSQDVNGHSLPPKVPSNPYNPDRIEVQLPENTTLSFQTNGDYVEIYVNKDGVKRRLSALLEGQRVEITRDGLQDIYKDLGVSFSRVSRSHLLIERNNYGIVLTDLGSTNGTVMQTKTAFTPPIGQVPSGKPITPAPIGRMKSPRPFDPNDRPRKGEWVLVEDSSANTQPPSGSIPSQMPAPASPTAGQVFHQTQLPLKNTTTMVFNGMQPQQFNGLQEVLVSAELNGLQKFELGIQVKQAEGVCVIRSVGQDNKIVSQSFPLNKPIQLGTNKELTITPFQDGSFEVQFRSSAPGAKVLLNDTLGAASKVFKSQGSLGSKFKEGYKSFLRTVPGLESVADFISDAADVSGVGD